MSLKVTISGVRGIYGETLTEQVACSFGIAYGRFLGVGKNVLIGSDTRVSGPVVKAAFLKGLKFAGVSFVDAGILPTPSVQVLVRSEGLAGGVIITASHNPGQWNGLKFVSPQGIFLQQGAIDTIKENLSAVTEAEVKTAENLELVIETDLQIQQKHLQKIIELVDVNKIKQANLSVVIDTCCGAGSIMAPQLLDKLGVKYFQLNAEPDISKCDRGLEPTPANIKGLGVTVLKQGAVIGLAQDPDADRLAIVNEKGLPIGEDYTLCLLADYMLALRKTGRFSGTNKICTNLSTTRIIDDIAKKNSAEVVRTKIGEVNVSQAMLETGAVVGGEGSGGIMIPSIGYGRDSLAGIAFMLEYLATSGKSVSQLVAENPAYVMYKTKIECTSSAQVADVLNKVKAYYINEQINDLDGIKIIFTDGNWVHVRASNTEPIIRIISEAETETKAKALADQVLAII